MSELVKTGPDSFEVQLPLCPRKRTQLGQSRHVLKAANNRYPCWVGESECSIFWCFLCTAKLARCHREKRQVWRFVPNLIFHRCGTELPRALRGCFRARCFPYRPICRAYSGSKGSPVLHRRAFFIGDHPVTKETYLKPREAAEYLRSSTSTLAKARM